MPWYFYFALKQLFPTGKRFAFTTLVTVTGVILGVMVLIIVQSVMNGFSAEIRSRIIDYHGDIRIESSRGYIPEGDTILTLATKNPSVTKAIPYVEGIVMLQHKNRPSFPYIRGVDTEHESAGLSIKDSIILGDFDELDDESILLSSGLARKLEARLGSTVEVYTPLMLEKAKEEEILLPRELLVVGIFETGWNQVDANVVIGTLRLVREFYNLGEETLHGVLVRIAPDADVLDVAAELNNELPLTLSARTWLESNRDLLWVLSLEKTMLFFIIIFIVLVASFSIAIALTLSVVRKTREIGLLVAIGATPQQVASSFCLQGFIIGLVGTTLGVAGALIALFFRNGIVQAFARLTNSKDTLLHFYQFSDIPVYYSITDFIIIILFTVITTTLAGLIPAWKAVRLKPSEALRHE